MTDPLDRFAQRSRETALFFGHAMQTYASLHGLTDASLAARLGCDVETLTMLRLCRCVRAETLGTDVRAIADRFGLWPEVVREIAEGGLS